MNKNALVEAAAEVLKQNDRGQWTVPSGKLYPHQWLWDSCFIAIGLRHIDPYRAKTELESLLRGQWRDGMMPHIIFSAEHTTFDSLLWDKAHSKHAPGKEATSGITQPPMLAEAVWLVGQKLDPKERKTWFAKMLPHIISYHEWIYKERDPYGTGLATLFHPYESGLDNSPPWMALLRQHGFPWWLKLLDWLHLTSLINLGRRDLKFSPLKERMADNEALALISGVHHLKSKNYDSRKIFKDPFLLVQDVIYNSILVRANEHLIKISKTAEIGLDGNLVFKFSLTKQAIEKLWNDNSQAFNHRNCLNGLLVDVPSIATLLPLFSGAISKDKATKLVEKLKNDDEFFSPYPLPTVPQNSKYFSHFRYWQGPTWISMNWFVYQGLLSYGYKNEAEKLKNKTLELVALSGFSEYFNPITGKGLGADNFSWTAALTIDLAKD